MAKEVSNIIEFTLIYNRHKVYLFNYVKKMVNNLSAAEDIIQIVFLKFYENLELIREKDKCEFWLFKTARNEVFNYYRSKKNKASCFENADTDEILPIDDEGTEILFDRKEMNSIIMNELNSFPDEQRDVYLLKEYSGLSYKEIAGLMNIDEELVKSRLFKIRRKLADKVSKILFYGVKS